MNLATRIERLENAAGRGREEGLPPVMLDFVEAVQNEDGMMRPGRCAGHLRLAFGEPSQWFDADMNPVAGPA
ncbi:MAG: hypothetical protein LBU64_07980 [Planctomycetota bacterium]|jgi:hypothetical protein|nr:hypothetical protein [Planctomycetota bacterium]